MLLLLSAPAGEALATTFTVTQNGDAADPTPGDGICDVDAGTAGNQCSLRAAVQTANALGGSHIIRLPAGTYTLSIGGQGEDAAATGDLDITATVTVRSSDTSIGTAAISGSALDRIFDVQPGGTLTLVGITVNNGDSGNDPGGAIRSQGTLTLVGLNVANNTNANNAVGGGAIAVESGTTELYTSLVSNNTAPRGGNISVADGATLRLFNSTVRNGNAIADVGGGIATGGTFAATDSTIASNDASVSGGGIHVFDGTVTLNRVTIFDNEQISASSSGGGLNIVPGPSTGGANVTLLNSTLSGNSAGGGGGAIAVRSVSDSVILRLTNVTIGTNTASTLPATAGMYLAQNTNSLTVISSNTIFESGCATISGAPSVANTGGNIRTTGNGCPGSDANTNGLLLIGLSDNGGFTQTIAMVATSDAVDAGVGPGCPTIDQRGLTRTLGISCDSGAYEVGLLGNGPPVISPIPDQAVDEDHPTGVVGVEIADSDTPLGIGLSLSVSANTSPAVPSGSITFVGAGTSWALHGTPDTDKNGSGTVTVEVSDGSATATSAFTLAVNAVNDAPQFGFGGNPPASNEDAGAQAVVGFATSPRGGPLTATDETGQGLTFNLTQTGTTGGLTFSSAPTVNAGTGNLFYTAAANSSGTATYIMTLSDNGGTANGGVDTSGVQTFTITVNGVNDPPVNTVPSAQVTAANTGLVFSTATSNAISFADADAGAAVNLTVTASVPAGVGVLTRGPSGLAAVTGNGTNSLQLTGSIANINADLQGLSFTPQSGVTGVTTLTVVTNDAGNTGTGGAQQDTDPVQITVSNLPVLTINDPSAIQEGNSGTTNLVFTVTLAPASALPVTVQYATSNGTATGSASCSGSADYQTTSGTLTFNPTETSKTVSVPICGDSTTESNETLSVDLSVPVNAIIGDAQGAGTIQNDDFSGTISFTAATASVNENGGSVQLTVQRTGGTASGVSVQYGTGDQTAQAGSDFTATTGTLYFGAGETTKTVTIPIINDSNTEPTETFTVTLANATGGATLGTPNVATVTIVDTSVPAPALQGQDDTDPSRKNTKENKDVKETQEQQQQRERTNRSNRDDIATEGNVTELHLDEAQPFVVLGNRDGEVKIVLLCGDQCPTIRVGDYIEVDGEKIHEQLYEAEQVTVKK